MEDYRTQQKKSFSKLAIASLVCALLSLMILVPHLLWVRGITVFQIYGSPILSFILGLLVVGFMGFPLHLYLLLFLTIILGILALIAIRNNGGLRGKSMALFCIILGGCMVLCYIFGVYIMGIIWGWKAEVM